MASPPRELNLAIYIQHTHVYVQSCNANASNHTPACTRNAATPTTTPPTACHNLAMPRSDYPPLYYNQVSGLCRQTHTFTSIPSTTNTSRDKSIAACAASAMPSVKPNGTTPATPSKLAPTCTQTQQLLHPLLCSAL